MKDGEVFARTRQKRIIQKVGLGLSGTPLRTPPSRMGKVALRARGQAGCPPKKPHTPPITAKT